MSEAVECDVLLLVWPESGPPLAYFEWGGCWSETNCGRDQAESDRADAALAELEAWFEAGGPPLGAELPDGWRVAAALSAATYTRALQGDGHALQ